MAPKWRTTLSSPGQAPHSGAAPRYSSPAVRLSLIQCLECAGAEALLKFVSDSQLGRENPKQARLRRMIDAGAPDHTAAGAGRTAWGSKKLGAAIPGMY